MQGTPAPKSPAAAALGAGPSGMLVLQPALEALYSGLAGHRQNVRHFIDANGHEVVMNALKAHLANLSVKARSVHFLTNASALVNLASCDSEWTP